MAISSNAQIEYEAGQTLNDWEAMTDSGDRTTFASSDAPWSKKSGFEAQVRPYGLITGAVISAAASGSNDVVDVTAATAYMPLESGASPNSSGVVSVTASTDLAVTRPGTGTHIIYSIIINTSGAFAAVAGPEGTSFSSTRNANGGPPLVPAGAVEVGHVRLSAQASAAVTADEIQQVPGTSQERWDFPGWQELAVLGKATFFSALPNIHDDGESPTGGTTKKVAIKFYTPSFAPIQRSFDWVPAANTYSVNSTTTYDGPVGASSSSLGQASWSSILSDGITDTILGLEGETLWVRYKQDRNKAPYQLTNGTLGLSQTFPADDQTQADFTLTPETKTANFSS